MPNVSGGNRLLNSQEIINHLGLEEGMKVADLGCGNLGHFVIPAAKLVGKAGTVYAVDILKTALKSVDNLAKTDNLENIVTVWSDVEQVGATKITPASVDVAVLKNVLFQSTKREAMIKEAARLIKTGGKLLIIDWNLAAAPLGPTKAMRVDPAEAQRLAEQNGLRLIDTFEAGQYHYGLVFAK